MSFDVKKEVENLVGRWVENCGSWQRDARTEFTDAFIRAIEATEQGCATECRQQAAAHERNKNSVTACAAVWAAQECALAIERRRRQREEQADE